METISEYSPCPNDSKKPHEYTKNTPKPQFLDIPASPDQANGDQKSANLFLSIFQTLMTPWMYYILSYNDITPKKDTQYPPKH